MTQHAIPFQKQSGLLIWCVRASKKIPTALSHFFLIQPFIYIAEFFEHMLLEREHKKNLQEYLEFADKFLLDNDQTSDNDQLKNDKEKLVEFAQTNENILNENEHSACEFLKDKLNESFLEGGPQTILQLSIIMQTGPSTTQYVTLVTSFLTFSFSATKLLLKYPTKVYLFKYLYNNMTVWNSNTNRFL